METVNLLCEGSCNPDRLDAEAAVDDHQQAHPGMVVSPALAGRLRALRYTPHVCVSASTLWRCTICEAVRRYGR